MTNEKNNDEVESTTRINVLANRLIEEYKMRFEKANSTPSEQLKLLGLQPNDKEDEESLLIKKKEIENLEKMIIDKKLKNNSINNSLDNHLSALKNIKHLLNNRIKETHIRDFKEAPNDPKLKLNLEKLKNNNKDEIKIDNSGVKNRFQKTKPSRNLSSENKNNTLNSNKNNIKIDRHVKSPATSREKEIKINNIYYKKNIGNIETFKEKIKENKSKIEKQKEELKNTLKEIEKLSKLEKTSKSHSKEKNNNKSVSPESTKIESSQDFYKKKKNIVESAEKSLTTRENKEKNNNKKPDYLVEIKSVNKRAKSNNNCTENQEQKVKNNIYKKNFIQKPKKGLSQIKTKPEISKSKEKELSIRNVKIDLKFKQIFIIADPESLKFIKKKNHILERLNNLGTVNEKLNMKSNIKISNHAYYFIDNAKTVKITKNMNIENINSQTKLNNFSFTYKKQTIIYSVPLPKELIKYEKNSSKRTSRYITTRKDTIEDKDQSSSSSIKNNISASLKNDELSQEYQGEESKWDSLNQNKISKVNERTASSAISAKIFTKSENDQILSMNFESIEKDKIFDEVKNQVETTTDDTNGLRYSVKANFDDKNLVESLNYNDSNLIIKNDRKQSDKIKAYQENIKVVVSVTNSLYQSQDSMLRFKEVDEILQGMANDAGLKTIEFENYQNEIKGVLNQFENL